MTATALSRAVDFSREKFLETRLSESSSRYRFAWRGQKIEVAHDLAAMAAGAPGKPARPAPAVHVQQIINLKY
jgi:hypothetical protein